MNLNNLGKMIYFVARNVNKKTISLRYLFNRLLLAESYYRKRTRSRGFPLRLNIESTNRCNLKCKMCPHGLGGIKRPIGSMTLPLFKKIVDESKKKTEFIYLHLFGEPLLNKNICNFIEYCTENDILTGMASNGCFLTKEISEKLINTGLNFLILSLDGLSKESYENIRIGANFDVVYSNIRSFIKKKDEKKSKIPYTVIQMIEMKENSDQAHSFNEMWRGLRTTIPYVKQCADWGGQVEKLPAILHRYPPTEKRAHCGSLWTELTILWDGSVVPCCVDFDKKYVLGNVTERSLSEIWNGHSMQELRKKLINGKHNEIALCKNCDSYSFGLKKIFLDSLTMAKVVL